MSKPTWQTRAEKLDFDPNGSAQNRVWARVSQRRVIAWKRPLAWAGCAVFVLALGAVVVNWLPSPWQVPAAEAGLTEEDCAELNSRYLLAKALIASEENCPCEEHLSSYDKRTMSHLRKGLESVACTACSPQEQARLKQCAVKYPSQIKELKLCRTLC